jgi:hypothetical protein
MDASGNALTVWSKSDGTRDNIWASYYWSPVPMPIIDRDNDSVPDDIDNCRFAANSNQTDSDGDQAGDVCDNCIQVPNPDQRDTDGDGLGNRCDSDLNNDNSVNILDLGMFKKLFNSKNPHADLNGDGSVNILDLGIFKQLFNKPLGSGTSTP